MTGFLEQVKVATPCHASWANMTGDDRRRFCAECKLNVYNLSDMTRDDAERFVRDAEVASASACTVVVEDGTVITRDCPVGIGERARRAVRAGWRRMMTAAVLAISMVIPAVGCGRATGAPTNSAGSTAGNAGGINQNQSGSPASNANVPEVPVHPEVIMGDMCPPEEWPEPTGNDHPDDDSDGSDDSGTPGQ